MYVNEVIGSGAVVLFPQIGEFLICQENPAYAEKACWDFLYIKTIVSPCYLQVVASVVVYLYYYLGLYLFVVPDCQVEIGNIACFIESPSVAGYFISRDVEGVASCQGDVLVFGSVVNAILSDELERTICGIFLEDSDYTFGERDAEFVVFSVGELYLVAGLAVCLTVTSCWEGELVVFSHIYSVGFGDKLHLFLWVVVQSHWFT